MNKTIRIIQNYLLYASPFVLACMIWSTLRPEGGKYLANLPFLIQALWEALSWNLMLWFAILIFFLALLVIFPIAREKTLKRLANLKDRDEREQYITGKAARSAYIATLSLLIFLLFFSIFSVNISRAPKSEAINGKTKVLSISLGFHLLDKPYVAKNPSNLQVLFKSKDFFSKTSILLIIIIWQLLAFNITARRENR